MVLNLYSVFNTLMGMFGPKQLQLVLSDFFISENDYLLKVLLFDELVHNINLLRHTFKRWTAFDT